MQIQVLIVVKEMDNDKNKVEKVNYLVGMEMVKIKILNLISDIWHQNLNKKEKIRNIILEHHFCDILLY